MQQENSSPLPLSMVPQDCGYNMLSNSMMLVMTIPYDGCNVVQQLNKLPMQCPQSWLLPRNLSTHTYIAWVFRCRIQFLSSWTTILDFFAAPVPHCCPLVCCLSEGIVSPGELFALAIVWYWSNTSNVWYWRCALHTWRMRLTWHWRLNLAQSQRLYKKMNDRQIMTLIIIITWNKGCSRVSSLESKSSLKSFEVESKSSLKSQVVRISYHILQGCRMRLLANKNFQLI